MPDEKKRPDNDDLSQRLESLKGKLAQNNRHQETKVEVASPNSRANVGQALRLGSEFVAGIVVGAAIGYGFDYLFGTSPWGFIVFFLLGFLAAILNVLRASGMVAESGMRLKNAQELANQREKQAAGANSPDKHDKASKKE